MSLFNYNRRDFLKTISFGTAALTVPGIMNLSQKFAGQKRKESPNVLFIAIDDLNDWVGCLGGHPNTKTPNIDKLAKRGLLFTNAYCSAPLCNPSRTSLMTGILPSTSGIYYNNQPWRKALPDAVTLPQHFMAHGYYVVGAGKLFHHGTHAFDTASWQDYFPSQTEFPGQCMPKHPKHPDFSPGHPVPKGAPFSFGPLQIPDEEMSDWKITDWVIQQLHQKHDKPFFLGCGIFRPHLAWFVPQKYFDMHPLEKVVLPNVNEHDLDEIPPMGKKWAKPNGDHRKLTTNHLWRRAVQAYLACISFADACVGRVIEALDKSPYADNTIIVLWSDHGWHLGEKLHWRKFALWQEATHNPMIIVAPNVTKPGMRCEHPVSLIDIYPTLVDLCDLTAREELEGVSLMPLLKDPATPWNRPALTTYGRNNHSVRSHRWRYIRYSDGAEELYDHYNDELEWTNLLWSARPPKAEHRKIADELARWLPETNAPEAPKIKKKP